MDNGGVIIHQLDFLQNEMVIFGLLGFRHILAKEYCKTYIGLHKKSIKNYDEASSSLYGQSEEISVYPKFFSYFF